MRRRAQTASKADIHSPMKHDDYTWHLEGDFPADLPSEAAATHIGMFLAWAIHAGCVSDLHRRGHARDRRGVLVWSPEHVEDRLRDHFAGRPNKWEESLRRSIFEET